MIFGECFYFYFMNFFLASQNLKKEMSQKLELINLASEVRQN